MSSGAAGAAEDEKEVEAIDLKGSAEIAKICN